MNINMVVIKIQGQAGHSKIDAEAVYWGLGVPHRKKKMEPSSLISLERIFFLLPFPQPIFYTFYLLISQLSPNTIALTPSETQI